MQVKQDQNNYNWAIANDHCDKNNPGTPFLSFNFTPLDIFKPYSKYEVYFWDRFYREKMTKLSKFTQRKCGKNDKNSTFFLETPQDVSKYNKWIAHIDSYTQNYFLVDSTNTGELLAEIERIQPEDISIKRP